VDLRIKALFAAAGDRRTHYTERRPGRLGWRGILLYVLAAPLPLAAIVSLAGGDFSQALAACGAFVLIAGAAYLNRRGLVEELVTHERRFTRSWALPHKYLAVSALTAGTVMAASGAVGHSLPVGVSFGLLAALGFHLSYGLPRPSTAFGVPRRIVSHKSTHKALADAERRVLAIEKAAMRIGNRELEQRLARIAAQGRAILEQIALRPEERFRARKFLNVYLEGAERVVSRYIRTHPVARGRELEQNFRNVLLEIESVFGQQLERLAEQDVSDLDVQIEVLRRQLEREGIS
jgi:hypothetical protein